MIVTIRPNLNKKAESTIHKGRLGKVIGYTGSVSIRCSNTVVRASGQALAQDKNEKTVHAGLIGEILNEIVEVTEQAKKIEYNPHKGDTCFHINGSPYYGGGVITSIGWHYYLVSNQ